MGLGPPQMMNDDTCGCVDCWLLTVEQEYTPKHSGVAPQLTWEMEHQLQFLHSTPN